MINKLVQNIVESLNKFEKFAFRTQTDFKVKSIHKLRVSIKELRAQLRLIEKTGLCNIERKEHFAILAPLFTSAGKVREAQVNRDLIKHFECNETYMDFIKKIEAESKNELKLQLSLFNMKQFNELNTALLDNTALLSDEDILEKSEAFLKHTIHSLIELASGDNLYPNLHLIRKKFRIALEVSELMLELNHSKKNRSIHAELEKMNERIGKWHDLFVLKESLSAFMDTVAEEIDAETSRSMIQITKFESRQAEKLIRKIRDFADVDKESLKKDEIQKENANG